MVHMFGVPRVKVSPSGGLPVQSGWVMSQAQRSSPVPASKPWITPEGASSFCPSSTWWPVTITPRTTTGGEVIETMPG